MKKRDWVIASWNINSVRLRKELVAKFLKSRQPDFLCLQEIKCQDADFPADFFAACGYAHQLICGQPAYHGVATLSRHPFVQQAQRTFGERKQDDHHARHVFGAFETASGVIGLHNFYVPSGGGKPDLKDNPKFAHKLRFLKDMKNFFSKDKKEKTILVGDLNVAPEENDVWSHEKLKNSIGHSPSEVSALRGVIEGGNFTDTARHFTPLNKKLYSWWSYRTPEWRTHNYGWRLDHMWATEDLVPQIKKYEMVRSYRGLTKPSDHAPILIELTL